MQPIATYRIVKNMEDVVTSETLPKLALSKLLLLPALGGVFAIDKGKIAIKTAYENQLIEIVIDDNEVFQNVIDQLSAAMKKVEEEDKKSDIIVP